MRPLPIGDSTRRLIAAVKKLENTLNTVGLPRFVARLPVCWLCWHYCRTLDQKIVRIRRIAGKFEQWLPTIRDFGKEGPAQLELIDVDHSMRDDIEVTKKTMWELRGYCIDVGRMFEQLGYQSLRLKRRQATFLQVLETSCVSASTMQEALVAHDSAVLALLRAQQTHERERAAAGSTS
ncbi:hypothetical protein SAMN05428959_10434 [Duganella sp. CF517]|uniref:hypothetical protein n=1 Tax=Duganella sp. CF517 TaxID=1881038 RepID=UPI0008D14693|nr:hypothetical protein [Duganella sp. CF517]SEN98756.1 hypothetical protein SAMN05428959_10434 [Duganella sp. CF517]